jgi:nitroimidazol reductase NimA-like FMN-containing flavoprotein (pyridoxamine 5'-phosphate oxidase superfamily)
VIGSLDREAIEVLLTEARIARLAIHPLPGNDHPLLVPIPCFYTGGSFVVLSGPGQKIEAMRRNPRVTVEVDRFRATNDWESVVAQGSYRELTSKIERQLAIESIAALSGEPVVIGENSILFQIIIVSLSGRYERPDDHRNVVH